MAYTKEQLDWIWLSSIHGLGAKRFDILLSACGSPTKVLEEAGGWMSPLIGRVATEAIKNSRNDRYREELFHSLERCGGHAITREDPEYPPLLRTIIDAPPTLFVRGRMTLADPMVLGIVGARNCTAYGTRMTRKLSRALSEAGVTVVSGLARGIDCAAHRGAIDARARTVAVLGCGADITYPPEHEILQREILDNGGSIITEFRPGTPPKGQHFPARNRIISGMSQGILLSEAAERSGAMSTVMHAQEQGREVLALPGQADSPLSASTNALIREGARLVTSIQDIFEDLGWAFEKTPPGGIHGVTRALPMTQQEQRVYNALAGGPTDTDTLVELLDMTSQALNSLLTIMELQGLIRKLPGRKVERATINRRP